MILVRILALFAFLISSSLAHADDSVGYCVSSFVEMSQREVEDESFENRMQHLYFHCGAVPLVDYYAESLLIANMTSTTLSYLWELTNQNPNFGEVVVGYGRDYRGFRFQGSTTLDGFFYLNIQKKF